MNSKILNKKILIVDDEPIISEMYKSLFELEGFVCHTANDAKTALSLVPKTEPDLIISDIIMPKVNGFEFRKQVMEMEGYSNIPFVFLTSNNNDEYILKGYNLDITNYIPKSTNLTILLKKIDSIFASASKSAEAIQKELTTAANKVDDELLNKKIDNFNSIAIDQKKIPFQGIPGGDFVDYIKLDNNRLAIVVGDIMGKKWKAWFVSFAFISYIRSTIRGTVEDTNLIDPSCMLSRINSLLLADEKLSDILISLSLLIIDTEKKSIYYSGAGDLPLIKRNNIICTSYFSSGINLGIRDNGEYDTIEIEYSQGDQFYIYTDGVTEAKNSDDDLLGHRGLKNFIETSFYGSIESVWDKITAWSNGKLDDDFTLVSVKC